MFNCSHSSDSNLCKCYEFCENFWLLTMYKCMNSLGHRFCSRLNTEHICTENGNSYWCLDSRSEFEVSLWWLALCSESWVFSITTWATLNCNLTFYSGGLMQGKKPMSTRCRRNKALVEEKLLVIWQTQGSLLQLRHQRGITQRFSLLLGKRLMLLGPNRFVAGTVSPASFRAWFMFKIK